MGGSSSQQPGHTSLGGRGALPRRWSVLKENLWGAAVPNDPATPAGGGRGVVPRVRSVPKERNSCNALPRCLRH